MTNNIIRVKRRIPFMVGEKPNMLVDEQYRKCVTFLVVDVIDNDTRIIKRIPAATAFFVQVPVNNEGFVNYAVTARHVVDASRPHGSLFVRINKISGGFQDFSAPQDAWVCHPSTDVAVIPVGLPHEQFDLRTIPLSMLATDDYVIQQRIGAGDDVFFVGLFSEYAGQERIQPIIRFGNISLMPHEKIAVKLDPGSDATTLIDAYLVEARSWGGHSGSPAFIYYPPDRDPARIVVGGNPPALLGVVHGHYEIKQDVAFIGDILGSGKVPINAGMAVVIPAQKIIDTLMQEALVEERNRILQEHHRRKPTPKPDVSHPESPP
jgi:hypothetical protein